MLTSKTRRDSSERSRTGSTQRVIRQNGELFGVIHESRASKTARDDYFRPESTYSSSFVVPRTSDQLNSSGSSFKKPLMPYKMNAPRNMLPVRFSHDTVQGRKNARNSSQFNLRDGANSDRTRFRTTNQVSYINHSGGLPVGFENKGILSEKTKWFHKRQMD
ncbi:hypothetical protein NAEGRDRAFT_79157 [Naegleria gruberi]|uniref:Uncharacterized protein n=1 Tax=Naegleria gruberi TaxID=5762 RepID=D2V9Z3_NAEGR|nr:uncharacterized protein NAEGRDRAFT_79157 [Naegleria gruberi]EFC46219.1 hypothetical protein NAEGRDRAFT_79157 [Naegleria gruberi]|eukprot:XP_002678963.1 hypothetical protein NAEGRDRAFT_79157 [Naegleria gruberi strain NEG-M]